MIGWVNGRAGAAIDARDRGFSYGDGLFETMRVRHRAVRFLDYHLQRLVEGCARLSLTPPDLRRVRREVERAAALRSESVLKLIVTRGIGPRGYRPSGRERSTRVLLLDRLPRYPVAEGAWGARVRVCATRLGTNEALAGMKTLNRLESVLARAEWADGRVWEGLLRDADDNLVCGTLSNLFLRRGARLLTPRLDRCGVAGVMRRWVLEQAAALSLRVVQGRLRWADVARADEMFMTNAVLGIVPVASVRNGRVHRRFEQCDGARRLHQLLAST